jgi:hypothetical protein
VIVFVAFFVDDILAFPLVLLEEDALGGPFFGVVVCCDDFEAWDGQFPLEHVEARRVDQRSVVCLAQLVVVVLDSALGLRHVDLQSVDLLDPVLDCLF